MNLTLSLMMTWKEHPSIRLFARFASLTMSENTLQIAFEHFLWCKVHSIFFFFFSASLFSCSAHRSDFGSGSASSSVRKREYVFDEVMAYSHCAGI